MTYKKLLLGASLTLAALVPLSGALAQNINFGDNSSEWANDGECDDPRFSGTGMADILLDEDILHDANDCQRLFSKGRITQTTVAQKGTRIDFGNDTSQWSNDGECDDPRFGGPGTADILLDEDLGRDATDCRTLLQQGQVFVLNDVGTQTFVPSNVHYGDNSSEWANDGECDDPRFEGRGMADVLLDEDTAHDANDCRMLYESGQIAVVGQSGISSTINFGDDSSQWSNDGECDDPRFSGRGMADILLDEDTAHDATDCQYLYQSNQIDYIGAGSTPPPTPTPVTKIPPAANVNGKYRDLIDSYACPADTASAEYGSFQDYGYWGGGIDQSCGGGEHPAGYYVWLNGYWYGWANLAETATKSSSVELCPNSALGVEQPLTCQCTAEATNSTRLWGTGIYTSDSQICAAAVHAGQISKNGGVVQIHPLPGQNNYNGTTRNGVTSSDWGSYGGSFSF